ncbi:rCG20398 [Rattus norvegicus]|uniref:RCG20398 n=1 Tax=Rattus norvegicus TaxID=10116 RepID=A6JGJ8_RAT|nr:rCG20398 [Rattus norvegicus]
MALLFKVDNNPMNLSDGVDGWMGKWDWKKQTSK